MRTKKEIEQRLSELKESLEYSKDMVERAKKAYKKERDLYGIADPSSLLLSQELARTLSQRILALEWVLGLGEI